MTPYKYDIIHLGNSPILVSTEIHKRRNCVHVKASDEFLHSVQYVDYVTVDKISKKFNQAGGPIDGKPVLWLRVNGYGPTSQIIYDPEEQAVYSISSLLQHSIYLRTEIYKDFHISDYTAYMIKHIGREFMAALSDGSYDENWKSI